MAGAFLCAGIGHAMSIPVVPELQRRSCFFAGGHNSCPFFLVID